jgi:prepilin-type N-terminal cleavage/methylation domain-containing protein
MTGKPRYALSSMNRFRRLAHLDGGFTIIEMMTVLAVAGILMAIAVPTISGQIRRQELRGAGSEIVGVLRNARDSAMNEGVPRYVVFDPSADPRTYQVWAYTGSPVAWRAQGPPVPLPSSVRFSPADVTFPPLADVPAAGASVPQFAAYFDTRGKYPFNPASPSTFQLTLRGGVDQTLALTVHASTGQVTGP